MQTHAKTKETLSNESSEYLEDYAMDWDMANLKADFLLEDVEGQLALRIVYWFIMTHGDMLQNLVGGNVNSFVAPHVQSNSSSTTATTTHPGNSSSANMSSPNQSTLPNVESKQSTSDHKNTGTTDNTNPASFQQLAKLSINLLKIAPRIRTYNKPQNVINKANYSCIFTYYAYLCRKYKIYVCTELI